MEPWYLCLIVNFGMQFFYLKLTCCLLSTLCFVQYLKQKTYNPLRLMNMCKLTIVTFENLAAFFLSPDMHEVCKANIVCNPDRLIQPRQGKIYQTSQVLFQIVSMLTWKTTTWAKIGKIICVGFSPDQLFIQPRQYRSVYITIQFFQIVSMLTCKITTWAKKKQVK